MQETTWVWVPSFQMEFRTKLITSSQQKVISFHIENEDDFEFSKITTDLLEENIIDKKETIRQWTILDKFFVLLQLRIKSYGHIIETQSGKIDLTEFIKEVAFFADNKFQYIFEKNNIVYECGLPTIQNELESLGLRRSKNKEDQNLSKIYDEPLWGYIQKITINSETIYFEDMDLNDRIEVFEQIPINITREIKNNFINVINESIEYKNFINFPEYKLDFNMQNASIVCKFILSYPIKYITEEYYALVQNHYSEMYIDSRPVCERMSIINLLKDKHEELEKENGENYKISD
jgi:hypothetical protein